MLSRVRAAEPGDGPTESHVIRFATQESFDGYMADPRRAAMADRRAKAILRTEMQQVDVITRPITTSSTAHGHGTASLQA